MELGKLLLKNYLPYAKATIISRAIPGIDGLKNVQRRVLYTMNKMGLLEGDKVKSHKVTGQTMGLHPHGDSSIYEAMVLMTTGYEGMNVPFVEGKGSFGKKYSRDLQYAAARYTEAKLAPICRELFEGINENAVDFVDNFDSSDKEPSLLPTKFPNLLVNNSTGVAVATSSNIPCFSLKKVCEAVVGILEGKIVNAADLADTLGVPEFPTGGFVHADKRMLEELCSTGKGTFVVSGGVEVYKDRIVIIEIPYTTTVEDIMDQIENCLKEKKIHGIRDVRDEIGLGGLRLVIDVKGGYESRDVLAQLNRFTDLRTTISFRTRVIINNRCKTLNLLELLNEWIKFRENCIERVYKFRENKLAAEENLEATWEKIKDNVKEVVLIIANNTEEVARVQLASKFKLNELQLDYLFDLKLKQITTNKAEAALKKLVKTREELAYCRQVVSDTNARHKIIITEQKEIIEKYGKDNKTSEAPVIVEEDVEKEVKISDEIVTVILTRDGYLRRLSVLKDYGGKYVAKNGDYEVRRWVLKNNSHILVFDRFGVVHKILVDDIDASNKSQLTDKLIEMANIEKISDIVWIDSCGDYSGHFNLIYPNGRGMRVYYKSAEGKRNQYKGLYEPVEPGCFCITQADKFFLITAKNKAAYCDTSAIGVYSSRQAFKVARVTGNDCFVKVLSADKVPNIGMIDLDRYSRGYTVSIGMDVLWVPEQAEVKTETVNNDENTEG